MPEEVSSTVKTTSDGMVKISVEKYDELIAKAAEKPPVVQQTVVRNVKEVIKTPEMAATDDRNWGITFMVLGGTFLAVGVYRFRSGVNALKELAE